MKNIITYIALVIFAFSLQNCKKDKLEDLNCIQLTDVNAQPIGDYGSCNIQIQWKNSSLSSRELTYLDFPDAIDMSDTENQVITSAFVYPNPAQLNGVLNFGFASSEANKNLKIQLGIVDMERNVLLQESVKLNRMGDLSLQLNDNIFEAGKFYRLYYRMSSKDESSLFEGYGNILVCDGPVESVEDCL